MTVTFVDAQLPAKLPTANEPLDFTLDTDPVESVVSVEFPGVAWETVWQTTQDAPAGTFGPLYQGSSRVGSAFSVVRTGGWPGNVLFKLHVKEQAAVTPSTTGWDVLLDFDFTAQPTGAVFPYNTPGTYVETIGGILWNCRWAGNANPFSGQQQINGTGYRLACVADGANGSAGTGGGSYIATDPTLLPGYVAGRHMAVLANFTSPVLVNAGSRAAVGHFKPISPAGQGSAAWVTGSAILGAYTPRVSNGDNAPVLSATGANDTPDPSTTFLSTLTTTTANYVFGAIRYSGTYGQALHGAYSGAQPTIESMKTAGGVDTSYAGGVTGLVAGVLAGASSNPSTPLIYNVQRIVIYQAKA